MLYSILAGIFAYHGIVFLIGIMVKLMAIEGTLATFAALCFIGAYLARSSGFVLRLGCWIGGVVSFIVLANWILLPVLQGSGSEWVTTLATFVGIICYIATRWPWHNHYLKRDKNGLRIPPPFGREWARWLIVFAG